jgi:hypothetical protein
VRWNFLHLKIAFVAEVASSIVIRVTVNTLTVTSMSGYPDSIVVSGDRGEVQDTD